MLISQMVTGGMLFGTQPYFIMSHRLVPSATPRLRKPGAETSPTFLASESSAVRLSSISPTKCMVSSLPNPWCARSSATLGSVRLIALCIAPLGVSLSPVMLSSMRGGPTLLSSALSSMPTTRLCHSSPSHLTLPLMLPPPLPLLFPLPPPLLSPLTHTPHLPRYAPSAPLDHLSEMTILDTRSRPTIANVPRSKQRSSSPTRPMSRGCTTKP